MEKAPEVIVFIGVQASGKSSFYRARFADSHVRINLDMLRTRHRENILFEACLAAKQSLVIDNTNPTSDCRARYLPRALEHGFSTIGYYFQSKIKDAIDRNSTRPEQQRVPDAGIRATYSKLQLPHFSEGFDQLFYVAHGPDGQFQPTPWKDEV